MCGSNFRNLLAYQLVKGSGAIGDERIVCLFVEYVFRGLASSRTLIWGLSSGRMKQKKLKRS